MMRISCVFAIVWCICLCKTSLAQEVYELTQPGLQNCYYIDTYKTDFEPGEQLVRCERSFFKKLFKNWGKWGNNECTQCCPNTGGYNGGSAGNGDMNGGYANGNGYYKEEEPYDMGYEPFFNPQDVPAGHHGHIYMPLPHPHRVMSHLHNYLNRPFRRGYGGKVGPPGYYPPKESAAPAPAAAVEEKPEVPKEEPADVYEEPAPVPVEEPTPVYTEKPTYPSEEKYDQQEEDAGKSYDEKKYEKEEPPVPAPASAPAPVTTQVIQPIVPIIAPPVYVYQPQYYTPPAVQPMSYMYPAPPSPSYPAPVQYTTPPQAAYSYSLPAPTYTPATPPVTSVQYNSPPALVYPTPGPIYSPPGPSYPQLQPQPQPQPLPQPIPTYTPPAALSYSPPPPTYTPPSPLSYSPPPPSALPELAEPTLPCPFSNPSDCAYFKKTYSTSLTYLLPQSQSQSPSLPSSYSNVLTMPYDPNDQPMRSCPELFTTYQMSLQAATAPASRPY